MSRVRFVVSPVRRARNWQLTSKGGHVSKHATQAEAIDAGVTFCRSLWKDGKPAELIIKGRNGRVRDNRTYGNDPESIKG